MHAVPNVTLNNGVTIPQLGFGTFKIPPADTRQATLTALEVGYRHIDTAEMYGNEKEVGDAIRDSGIDRDDLFVTSKLNNGLHEAAAARTAFDQTLEDLGLEQLDLFLIHWPRPRTGNFVEAWQTLEEFYRAGRVRAIGVSNFKPHHVRRLMENSVVTPAVNQIEIHPYLTQDDVRAFNAEHDIATEAWSPLAKGTVLRDPVIVRIADDRGRTPAQVTLRWALQRGDIVFPKSVTRERVQENSLLFDFELSEADMAEISALNRDERTGSDPDENG
ncbi:oxidoreductase [Streptomyces camponoticapitis]|uniref:Oxidoreductase n=1 Tax=Streptomyces camponoticapitis TaxID=1616125 RepID=A0ABQ2E452_9ACTN|nr:aldo/keto reductase [Streptomyces camponoticapitis]GGJ91566.1 oxidoreductase [Streptomyces camponoticapitis]